MRLSDRFTFWISAIAVLVILLDLGFNQTGNIQKVIDLGYLLVLLFGLITITVRYLSPVKRPRKSVWFLDFVFLVANLLLAATLLEYMAMPFFKFSTWVQIALWILFFREFFLLEINLSRRYLNPAQFFVISFLLMILVGTLILMLPRATHAGISFLDALFTATSAVCVTGLIVVDTGSYFTVFGQTSILILIQLGGLGIMTLTSYFSYFFRGGTTYENQLLLKDMTNADKIAEVFETLKKILVMTFFIELTGLILIYLTLKMEHGTIPDRLFFSLFHSISSFCNAGFSTLQNSLYESSYRYNYPLHLIIALLFILGGIGFPIIFNFSRYLRYKLFNLWLLIMSRQKELRHHPWIININTRIVVVSTILLLTVGTLVFFLSEFDNSLAEHNGFGKLVTAFFSAATPRTAGFNSVDFSSLHFSTIMLIFLLMWIGASPGSTGGGIKTSTFVILLLNLISLARGKGRIEIYRREISNLSTRRAFAIVTASLFIIGTSIFMISWFDAQQDLLHIAFECFSAYSTVGLSLGITSQLSHASQLVIIFTMFIGRVGMLTLLIAVVRKMKDQQYRYPTEEILIN